MATRNLPVREARGLLGNRVLSRRMCLKVLAAEERWTGIRRWTPFSKRCVRIG